MQKILDEEDAVDVLIELIKDKKEKRASYDVPMHFHKTQKVGSIGNGLGMKKAATTAHRKNEGVDFLVRETDEDKIKMAEEID